MRTFFARPFISMGEELQDIKLLYAFSSSGASADPLTAEEKESVIEHFARLTELCEKLDMPISRSLLVDKEPPQTEREFEIIRKVLDAELRDKLMVFVPSHRRKYFNRKFIDDSVLAAFPGPHLELRLAGQCFAVGLYTASVFHAMRAVEVGLRLMAAELQVTLVEGIDNAQWETLIRQIEAKIKGMIDLPKTPEKAALLNFYSEASIQFRYFKDGWRIRAAHSKAVFDEPQALIALEHAHEFFKTLAIRLKE
jgi:hypothetical protein